MLATSSLVSELVVVELEAGRAEGVEEEVGCLVEPSLKLGFLDTSELLSAVTFLASPGLCWASSGGSEAARVLLSAADPDVSALADCRKTKETLTTKIFQMLWH